MEKYEEQGQRVIELLEQILASQRDSQAKVIELIDADKARWQQLQHHLEKTEAFQQEAQRSVKSQRMIQLVALPLLLGFAAFCLYMALRSS